MKPRIAVIRGKFLNRYEMQFFEPLTAWFDITAFASRTPFHDTFTFPVTKLISPMDIPDFPYKLSLINRLFTDAQYLFGLEYALKGFDLVHTAETYYRYTQQSLDAKKRGFVKKVIVTVLETIPFNNEGISGRSTYKERTRNEADHLVALTERAKHTLIQEGADPKKITVIPHFIDTRRFHPSPDWKKRAVAKRMERTILFTGRLEEYKGILDIFSAMDILTTDPDLRSYRLHLQLVGDGSLRNMVKRQTDQIGKKWHLHCSSAKYEQMPQVYRNADLYVAPSKPRVVSRFGRSITTWEEQYGVALMEAQASALPIVTTSSGAIPENVRDAALVVSPGNPMELAQAMKRFLTSTPLRLEYASRARSRAIHHHDLQVGAHRMKQLYETILER